MPEAAGLPTTVPRAVSPSPRTILGNLSRRALMSGASIALAAASTVLTLVNAPEAAPRTGDPDSALLMACADFHLACVEQRRRNVTDEESGALLAAFYATLARVEEMHPTTQEGLCAKALAARTALMEQVHTCFRKNWREEASPEERVVMDTLLHVADGLLA